MKKIIIHLLLLAFAIVSCNRTEDGDGTENQKNLSVSQYEARAWDGVKRGGVFYEIFVRSYADSNGDGIGDLRGITEKLDYLDELGVAGIWLTPIHPSPSYHGYDVENYTAINPQFGTMNDFEALVTKAHELGIKVILDMVVNHSSKTHPWFKDACSSESSPYRDYYLFGKTATLVSEITSGLIPMTNQYHDWQWHRVPNGTTDYSYMGWFSDWMPELNYGSVANCEDSPAFKAMCDAARFWISKGVDGFRLDAIKHVYQNETSDENPEFWRKFYTEIKKTKADVYMVGEMFASSDQVAPYYKGLPAHFEFEGWEKLQYAINNNHAKWFPKDMLSYAAKYAAVRPDYIQATKLANHDEDRTRTTLGNSIDKAKIAAAVLLTVSGSPYVYYGEELGMMGSKAGGDENVRDPFLWAPAAKDNYRTTWRKSIYSTDATIGNYATQKDDSRSIWRLYEKFIELRNTYPSLAYGEMLLPEGFNDGSDINKHLMIFYRQYQNEKLYVIHNVSHQYTTYAIPETLKRPIADFGKVVATEKSGHYTVTMPPYTTIIFEM